MGEMVAIYQDLHTKAYVVEEKGGPFILKDVVLDEVRADEVLVEIKYSGLCHTVRLFPRSLFLPRI
jgi:Zn-dependent alcohol dehydrogenase